MPSEPQPSPITPEQIAAQYTAAEAFAEAAAVLARLRGPGGCPWDREQTLSSITPHTLEEVYEVFDAIDRGDDAALTDELGDLLLQVLFYAQIGSDEGRFTLEQVARGLTAKLLRRHPHVFGGAAAETSADVVNTWDRIKRQERAATAAEGALDGVPRTMPGLLEARKIGSRAAKVGFDWPSVGSLFEKVHEELAELREELGAVTPEAARVEEEFGDLLFVMTNLARHLHVDAELALKKANAKFRRRFAGVERLAGGTEALAAMTAPRMEQLWAEVKAGERLP